MNKTTPSIMHGPVGRDISVRETFRQITPMVMMSCGVQVKTLTFARDWFKVKVSRKYWMTIKLNGLDLYDVEVGVVRKKDGLPTYKVLEQELNVFAEDLSKTVLKMGDRA